MKLGKMRTNQRKKLVKLRRECAEMESGMMLWVVIRQPSEVGLFLYNYFQGGGFLEEGEGVIQYNFGLCSYIGFSFLGLVTAMYIYFDSSQSS